MIDTDDESKLTGPAERAEQWEIVVQEAHLAWDSLKDAIHGLWVLQCEYEEWLNSLSDAGLATSRLSEKLSAIRALNIVGLATSMEDMINVAREIDPPRDSVL